jgi:tRNA (cmo5U34)-methyltransferase
MKGHSPYCPAQMVPAYDDLPRMAQVLLAQQMGAGSVLVLGAGGGNEMAALAAARADWRFVGVDPSAQMLDLARSKCAALSDRITYIHGTIEAAPQGPFDGATCILTLHFLPKEERLATLRALRARLRAGAALVVAHHSIPAGEAGVWLPRFADFAANNGAVGPTLANGAQALGKALPILTPEEDMDVMRAAGFGDVAQFYHAFTFRGFAGFAQ